MDHHYFYKREQQKRIIQRVICGWPVDFVLDESNKREDLFSAARAANGEFTDGPSLFI